MMHVHAIMVDLIQLIIIKEKLSILSSFTLEGLSETLIVKCAEKDIKCKTFVSGYNQYNQEILKDNSQLHNFSPEITFLILDPRKIFGSLFYNSYELSKEQRIDFVNKKFNEIKELIDFFKSKSKSKLVISNFWVPTYSLALQHCSRGLQRELHHYSVKTNARTCMHDVLGHGRP